MENFKVTSIDDAQLETNENKENLQEQAQEPAQEPVQEHAEEKVLEQPTESVTEEVKEEVKDEQASFETASIEFDKQPELEKAEVEHDVPNKVDLKSFIEENKDLIKQYAVVDRDYSQVSDVDAIESHLKDAHPSLSQDDINILLEDYSYDEENDDKAAVVKKKLAIEKAATEARNYLNDKKDQFIQDLGTRQLGGPSPQEIAQAEAAESAKTAFLTQTDEVFSGETKSFSFKLSDTKKLDIKINNPGAVKSQQSDINNFIGKYFDLETGQPIDLEGYHRDMFVAMNIDSMLQNAYQQGEADQAKKEAAAAKNIDMDARGSHQTAPKKGSWKLVD